MARQNSRGTVPPTILASIRRSAPRSRGSRVRTACRTVPCHRSGARRPRPCRLRIARGTHLAGPRGLHLELAQHAVDITSVAARPCRRSGLARLLVGVDRKVGSRGESLKAMDILSWSALSSARPPARSPAREGDRLQDDRLGLVGEGAPVVGFFRPTAAAMSPA